LWGVPEYFCNRWAYIGQLFFAVVDGNDFGGILEQGVQPFLGVFNLFYFSFKLLVRFFEFIVRCTHLLGILSKFLLVFPKLLGHLLSFLEQPFCFLINTKVKDCSGNYFSNFLEELDGEFGYLIFEGCKFQNAFKFLIGYKWN